MKIKGRKHAALIALLFAAALLLGGCVSQIQERPLADLSGGAIEAGVPAPQADGADEAQIMARLYYLAEDGTTLFPVSRRITVKDAHGRAHAALAALLAGPQAGEDGAVWPDLGEARSARLLEVSGGVATVDLPANARMLSQEMLYAVRLAIANTLTEFSEISYVNVLIGGREEGFDLGGTMPVGTLSRAEDLNTTARYHLLDEQRMSAEGITLLTTLYFPAADDDMILPEVRNVRYQQAAPIEYLYTLLEELGKGTQNVLTARTIPAPLDYIREMPEIVRTQDGAYRAIEIRFSAELDEALDEAGLSRGVYLAMLTDTLMGFVPGVEGLLVSIGEEQIAGVGDVTFANGLAVRSDFAGYVGAPAVLYAMESQGGGLLRLERVVGQAQANDPRARLVNLMRLTQGGAYFALPDGLNESDILAVHTGAGDIAVNLSARFRRAMERLDARQERAAVYAMVNTLTQGQHDVRRVVFFFEGEQVASLAGGLEMRGAFLRNPGMVVN